MIVGGKVALITGGARGIGRAYAEALLNKGAKVCVIDTLEPEGVATVQEFQAQYGLDHVIFIKCDVTDKDQLKTAFKETKKRLGGLHIVINNAGIGDTDNPMENFPMVIDVNVSATVHGTYLAVEHMTREKGGQGGVIINICSIMGFQTRPVYPEYVGSKHFVYGFTKCYAGMLADSSGVRLNMLCPTFVKTDLTSDVLDFINSEEHHPVKDIFHHYGGWVSMEEVTAALVRLVEEDEHQGAALLVTSGGQEIVTPTKHWT